MLKKLFAISLSIILLMSSTGVTLATHFCMGHAVETKLGFGKSEVDCGMGMAVVQTCEHETQLNRIPCCENEYRSAAHDETVTIAGFMLNLKWSFSTANISLFNWQPTFHTQTFTVNPDYSPPLLAREFPILLQSFLL